MEIPATTSELQAPKTCHSDQVLSAICHSFAPSCGVDRWIEWEPTSPSIFDDVNNANIPMTGVTSSGGSGMNGESQALFCKACSTSSSSRPVSGIRVSLSCPPSYLLSRLTCITCSGRYLLGCHAYQRQSPWLRLQLGRVDRQRSLLR
jgi:hypothetical protein